MRIKRSVNPESTARSLLSTLLILLALAGLTACSRLRYKPASSYVYASVKQTYLRDRIAAVSHRTATINNGDRLQILATGRHTLQVKTDKGEIGWINEGETVPATVAATFDTLKRTHAYDPVVATAVVRDTVSMHIAAGRDAGKLYLLQEGDKLNLLARATLPKPQPPGALTPKKQPAASATATPAPPAMEDWWLVRDAQNRVGWISSHFMDVDSPDAITRYAENQRVVSAKVLTTINDPDADATDKNIAVYVVAYAPYKSGLPYDFDQVRVFTWNRAKHRYETAYRERNMEGFLPLVTGTVPISSITDMKVAASLGGEPLPTFSYKVLSGDGIIVVDPVTGIPKPGQLIQKDYRVEGNYVRRILQPGQTTQLPQAHPEPEPEKKAASAKHAAKKKR